MLFPVYLPYRTPPFLLGIPFDGAFQILRDKASEVIVCKLKVNPSSLLRVQDLLFFIFYTLPILVLYFHINSAAFFPISYPTFYSVSKGHNSISVRKIQDKERTTNLKPLGNMADANQAALFDARRRAGSSSQMLDSIIQGSNCELHGKRHC